MRARSGIARESCQERPGRQRSSGGWSFDERQVQVECLDASGGQLWQDRVSGGVGLMKIEMNAKLLARMVKKLDKRIGGPCLPVG